MNEEISKNLAILIKASPKSKKQIAIEANITQSSLSHLLSGHSLPSVPVLKKLCQVLDCNYEDIMGRL